MKKNFTILIASVIAIGISTNVEAKKKVFYDSKSQLIGISGDYESLAVHGMEYKVFNNPVALPSDFKLELPENPKKGYEKEEDKEKIAQMENSLNNYRVGKQVLDYLFDYNGNSLHIDRLQDRALRNAQFLDAEYVKATLAGKDDIANALTEDEYLKPIVKNNFIYLEQRQDKSDIFFVIFRVNINEQTLTDVYNSWDNMEQYNAINPTVSYVCCGQADEDKLVAKIAEECPEFAIRGQLKSRNPATAYLGTGSGAKLGDRVLIYRQFADEQGDMYSKVVSHARINDISDGNSQLYFIGGTKGSKEQGDIVVLSPDKRIGLTFEGNYGTTGWYGASFTGDYLVCNIKKTAFNVYAMIDVRADFSNKLKKGRDLYFDNGAKLRFTKPLILDFGLGLGIGYTFLGRMEVVPYAKCQYELAYFLNKETRGSSDEKADLMSHAIRVPLGAKLNINICYPVQLTLGVDYSLMFGLNVVKDGDIEYSGNNSNDTGHWTLNYKWLKDNIYKPNDVKRNNLTFHAGIRVFF